MVIRLKDQTHAYITTYSDHRTISFEGLNGASITVQSNVKLTVNTIEALYSAFRGV